MIPQLYITILSYPKIYVTLTLYIYIHHNATTDAVSFSPFIPLIV